MHGPRLVVRDEDDDDQRPDDERLGGYDLSAVIGRRASEAAARGPPAHRADRWAGRRLPPGGGYAPPPGAPRPGQAFRPRGTWRPGARPTTAVGDAGAGRRPTRSSAIGDGSLPGRLPRAGLAPGRPGGLAPARCPGRAGRARYRDGQKVRHRVFGEGRVVSSKLTRDDEEVTVAFPGQGVKKLMASLAGLEVSS